MTTKNVTTKAKITTQIGHDHVISQAALAAIGDGQVAYLKSIKIQMILRRCFLALRVLRQA